MFLGNPEVLATKARTVAIKNPIAVYPGAGGAGSLGLDTATATAAHAETDGALYVQVCIARRR